MTRVEKGASDAILYPAAQVLLRYRPARETDVCVRLGWCWSGAFVSQHRLQPEDVSVRGEGFQRGPGGGGGMHVHLVLAGRSVRLSRTSPSCWATRCTCARSTEAKLRTIASTRTRSPRCSK